MSSYWAVANAFCKGEKVKRSWYTKVAGQGAFPNAPLFSNPGVIRMSINDDGTMLYSYEHWVLACRYVDRKGRVTILINADKGPSKTTEKQQRDLISAASQHRRCLLPFSALRAAGLQPQHLFEIELLDTTADRVIETPTATGVRRQHFLGETLFKHQDDVYVCGLDRNDDPARRNFYLARLPTRSRPPKTVEEALLRLRPRRLPDTAIRQGEWFLVPEEGKRVPKEKLLKAEEYKLRKGFPILSDVPEEQVREFRRVWRENRHVATRMYLNGSVYVSGMLRDTEHGNLKLGDGKTWYKVVRNLAGASWGAGGDVD